MMLSRWIDDYPPNMNRDSEAATWGRLAKIAEEAGEVVAAFIAATNQNPRKPLDPDAMDTVRRELLDVATTALAALEHVTWHQGTAIERLEMHVNTLLTRAEINQGGNDEENV